MRSAEENCLQPMQTLAVCYWRLGVSLLVTMATIHHCSRDGCSSSYGCFCCEYCRCLARLSWKLHIFVPTDGCSNIGICDCDCRCSLCFCLSRWSRTFFHQESVQLFVGVGLYSEAGYLSVLQSLQLSSLSFVEVGFLFLQHLLSPISRYPPSQSTLPPLHCLRGTPGPLSFSPLPRIEPLSTGMQVEVYFLLTDTTKSILSDVQIEAS